MYHPGEARLLLGVSLSARHTHTNAHLNPLPPPERGRFSGSGAPRAPLRGTALEGAQMRPRRSPTAHWVRMDVPYLPAPPGSEKSTMLDLRSSPPRAGAELLRWRRSHAERRDDGKYLQRRCAEACCGKLGARGFQNRRSPRCTVSTPPSTAFPIP